MRASCRKANVDFSVDWGLIDGRQVRTVAANEVREISSVTGCFHCNTVESMRVRFGAVLYGAGPLMMMREKKFYPLQPARWRAHFATILLLLPRVVAELACAPKSGAP